MSKEKERPGIECPRCGEGTRVANTINFQSWIKRHRVCTNYKCGYSFYTRERIMARPEHNEEPANG